MVVQFLLSAYYLLGACHRIAAYMYIGVVSKAATALGLHHLEQYHGLPPQEQRLRLKAWKSLRVLDTIYNSMLARISSIQGTRHAEPRLQRHAQPARPPSFPRAVALDAIFSICPFLDELEHLGNDPRTSSLEKFLLRLQRWSKALPEDLRHYPGSQNSSSSSINRELYLGAAHVACVYYFTVMLATRRHLTLSLLPKIRKHPVDTRHGQDPTTTLGFAQVCLNAAVSLVKVGQHAMLLGFMPSSMCMMKAWSFAAGLLLGFFMHVEPPGTDTEVEEAFECTRLVLNHRSDLVPLAGRYYDILTAFLEATARHHRRRGEDRRRTASRYMDSIFTTSNILPADIVEDASTVGSHPSIENTAVDDHALFSLADLYFPDGTSSQSLSLDDLTFDWQPVAPFFDDYV